MKLHHLKLILALASIGVLSCGEKEELETSSKYASADAVARETDPLLESDLSAMSDTEVTRLLGVLKKRNSKDARDYKILRDVNKELCQKLSEVKKQCTAIAPLMGATYDKLKCSEVDLKNDIVVSLSGSYKIVADNLYESNVITGFDQPVTFSSVTGAKDIDVRFIDVTKLVLKSVGGGASSPGATNFELKVNGETMFTAGDLEQDGSNFKVRLSKFLDLSKSPNCNISRAEIDDIKREIRAKHGEGV